MASINLLTLAVLLLAVVGLGNASLVEKAAKPAPVKLPVGFPRSCPAYPLQHCDFYLQNYRNVIPTFKLKKYHTDTILSGALFSGKTGYPLLMANTNDGCFFVPYVPGAGHTCGKAFYYEALKGPAFPLQANHLSARSIISSKQSYFNLFRNRCVYLEVSQAKIITKYATKKTPQQSIYLNPNDRNPTYPQSRRCIVFKTTI